MRFIRAIELTDTERETILKAVTWTGRAGVDVSRILNRPHLNVVDLTDLYRVLRSMEDDLKAMIATWETATGMHPHVLSWRTVVLPSIQSARTLIEIGFVTLDVPVPHIGEPVAW
jgi:hypothetical protein